MRLIIKNGIIYTPYQIKKDFWIIIDEGKICDVVPKRSKPPQGTSIIDAKGGIIAPGFIDIHIQGAGGYDVLDGTKSALKMISEVLPRFGTTSYLATTVFKDNDISHIKNIVDFKNLNGAELLGIHLEGPFVNPNKKGMIRTNGIRNCSAKGLNHILKETKNRLKIMTIAPELDGALDLIKRLKAKGVIASFGHSDATYEQAQAGISAGIRHVTHICNAMRPIHHRDPGPLIALLMNEQISVQLIADGIHIHPAVLKFIVRVKGVDNILLITDGMSSLGMPDGRYMYDGWEYVSKAGICRYEDGTLIGTSLPLNKLLRRMFEFTGISVLEALKMVTSNPAKLLGISSVKGSIEKGKDADIVIMDKNFNVKSTIIKGKVWEGK